MLVAAKLTGHKVRPQDEFDIASVLQSGVVLGLRGLLAAHPERLEIFLAIKERMAQD